mmetsp:Transcript_30997/g.81141  ORF Transcript_30997/g.81141 Transcript_30997/m.81141 type:complete len:331 (+) Transcript_30997:1530-2522(+)
MSPMEALANWPSATICARKSAFCASTAIVPAAAAWALSSLLLRHLTSPGTSSSSSSSFAVSGVMAMCRINCAAEVRWTTLSLWKRSTTLARPGSASTSLQQLAPRPSDVILARAALAATPHAGESCHVRSLTSFWITPSPASFSASETDSASAVLAAIAAAATLGLSGCFGSSDQIRAETATSILRSISRRRLSAFSAARATHHSACALVFLSAALTYCCTASIGAAVPFGFCLSAGPRSATTAMFSGLASSSPSTSRAWAWLEAYSSLDTMLSSFWSPPHTRTIIWFRGFFEARASAASASDCNSEYSECSSTMRHSSPPASPMAARAS